MSPKHTSAAVTLSWFIRRTMVTQLIEHERIQTTVAKAKELRKVADRVVTYAKRVRGRWVHHLAVDGL